jgi:hypothetical protein
MAYAILIFICGAIFGATTMLAILFVLADKLNQYENGVALRTNERKTHPWNIPSRS